MIQIIQNHFWACWWLVVIVTESLTTIRIDWKRK